MFVGGLFEAGTQLAIAIEYRGGRDQGHIKAETNPRLALVHFSACAGNDADSLLVCKFDAEKEMVGCGFPVARQGPYWAVTFIHNFFIQEIFQ